MKLFRTVIAALLLLCCTVVTAQDFTVDGIYYNILSSTDQTVEVTYNDELLYSASSYSGSITIPSSVTYSGTTYSVTTIGDLTFYYCPSLANVTLPNSLTTIGKHAFSCSSLASIEIPNSLTTIGREAFYCCDSLTNITLPNSLTTIGQEAFEFCSSLKSIEIPNSVTTIEEGAFNGCESLTSISVSGGNTTYDSHSNCNAIIETATNTLIAGCKNTVIPNSVTTIGSRAFSSCSSLTSIEIPSSVTTIGVEAFYGCDGLTSIEIPGSVTTIEQGAFGSCSSLASIEIPGSVTTIGSSAFYNCSSLASIEIPSSVTTIGEYAFYWCFGLTSITSHIPAEKLFAPGIGAFDDVNKYCTLYVPYGAKETYAATEGWNVFKNIVELSVFDLTVSAAKYATLYLDFDAVIPQGVEVYTASTVDGDRLMMQEVTGALPANTGVIVRAEQGTYTFAQSDEEVTAIENNLLCGSAEDVYITPAKGVKYYVLAM